MRGGSQYFSDAHSQSPTLALARSTRGRERKQETTLPRDDYHRNFRRLVLYSNRRQDIIAPGARQNIIVLTSLYRYRSFIWQHAIADLRHRYAGTGMGAVWNVLHPLSLIAVYALIFGAIGMGRNMPGVSGKWAFTIYLCVGFFPWIAFSDCVMRGAYALSGNAAYLKKLPVPEQVFVAQTAAAASITLLVSLALFILISIGLGLRPDWHWLLLPVPLILLQAIGFGFGLIVGTLNVFFTDVAQILSIVLQVLFWLTPIVYLPTQVPAALAHVLNFMPTTPAIVAVHDLFLSHKFPDLWTVPAMLAWACGTIACGYWLLSRLRNEIRDVI